MHSVSPIPPELLKTMATGQQNDAVKAPVECQVVIIQANGDSRLTAGRCPHHAQLIAAELASTLNCEYAVRESGGWIVDRRAEPLSAGQQSGWRVFPGFSEKVGFG